MSNDYYAFVVQLWPDLDHWRHKFVDQRTVYAVGPYDACSRVLRELAEREAGIFAVGDHMVAFIDEEDPCYIQNKAECITKAQFRLAYGVAGNYHLLRPIIEASIQDGKLTVYNSRVPS